MTRPETWQVVAAGPFVVPRPMGSWSCTRCGVEFPVGASWAATVRTGEREFAVVLCPDCGRELRPVRLVIDRTRLGEVHGQRAALASIADFAAWVAERRADEAPVIRLRSADTRVVADLCGCSVDDLVEELTAADVLLGTD